jgi:hypothetical protein
MGAMEGLKRIVFEAAPNDSVATHHQLSYNFYPNYPIARFQ